MSYTPRKEVILEGLASAIPTNFGDNEDDIGRLYFETDTATLKRWNGTSWEEYGGGNSTGTITGPETVTDGNLAVWDGTDGTKLKDGGAVPEGGGSPLLAYLEYAPETDAVIKASTSATLEDADATNLAITFTAPASGEVLVEIEGMVQDDGHTTWLGLREASTIIAGPYFMFNGGGAVRGHAMFKITGLSAGSHTYKFAIARDTGTAYLWGGPTFGKAVMKVSTL